MELHHSFRVPIGIDEAWTTFNDLERIAPCLPEGWTGYRAVVRGPDGAIRVEVSAHPGQDGGAVERTVDGTPLAEDLVAFPTDGSTLCVTVGVPGRGSRAG